MKLSKENQRGFFVGGECMFHFCKVYQRVKVIFIKIQISAGAHSPFAVL